MDLRITLKKLELFCLVAELESVTLAAERVYVTQPVVTSHMRGLADRLGVELFVRDGNRMILTEHGRIVHDWARQMLARTYDMSRALEEAIDGTRGAATISASQTIGSYLLPDIVARFKQERHAADIAVIVSPHEHVIQGVETGQYDFGLVISSDWVEHSAAVCSEQIGQEELLLIGPADGSPGEPTLTLDRLAELDLVCSPRATLRHRLVERLLQAQAIEPPSISVEFGSAEAMKRGVRAGLGVAFLFRSSVADELERGVLREIPIEGVQLMAPVYLLRRRDRTLSPMQAALMETIRAAVPSGKPAGDSPNGNAAIPAQPAVYRSG